LRPSQKPANPFFASLTGGPKPALRPEAIGSSHERKRRLLLNPAHPENGNALFSGPDTYPQRDLGIVTHSMSRPLIEGITRRFAVALGILEIDCGDDVVPQLTESTRGALMMPIEGGRWIVTPAGRYEQKPPGDSEGFLEFARHLRTPTLFNAIERATRLGDVVRYGFPRRRSRR
jgi:hypothetical protein